MAGAPNRDYRVALCSEKDVIPDPEKFLVYKKFIYEAWASIEVKKASQFTRDGVSMEDHKKVTHKIMMNYRSDVDISFAAWIYDKRLKSPPRWFRILKVSDDSEFFTFEVRLAENSEDAAKPATQETFGTIAKLREGVSL